MRTRYVIEICAFASISVRHGDAGDAVTSPTLEKWLLFGQKFSTFGQIIQLCSRLSGVVSILSSTEKNSAETILPVFASDGRIDRAFKSVVLKPFGSWATFVSQKPFAGHKN